MGRLDQLKRRVLREAVQGNAGTRPRLTSFRLTSGRHAGRAWGRRLLAGGLGLGLLLVSYALLAVVAAQRGLAPWALLVTFATGQGATPSSHGLAPEARAPSAAPTSIDFQIFPMSVRKIALDPGHGGEDGGAVTPLGTVEKDLTLDIARRLRRLLEHNAFEVLMTREHDDTVSLAERAVRANAGGADLFVSIHVNWFKTAEARGPETYYLGPTDDPHTLQLAALENRSSGYSLGQYRQLLENVYLDVRRTQPHLLARTIQRELDRRQHTGEASPASRGVKMAPFLALVATRMPAILTEIAYLSNQEEAQLLAAPEYRQRIAQSLLQGIRAYAAALNRSAKKGSCAMSDTRDILYVGIDLGTSRSAMSASNGERHMIESYLGWPVDLVARKILKRPVLIGHDAVDQRSMLDLRRPLERGLIKEGSEKDAAAVRELLRQLVSLTGMVAPPENGSRVCAVVEAPAEALRVNKQQLRNAMKGIADSLMVVSEPFAVAYGTEALLHTMIIDIGAGTADFCVMNGRYPSALHQQHDIN